MTAPTRDHRPRAAGSEAAEGLRPGQKIHLPEDHQDRRQQRDHGDHADHDADRGDRAEAGLPVAAASLPLASVDDDVAVVQREVDELTGRQRRRRNRTSSTGACPTSRRHSSRAQVLEGGAVAVQTRRMPVPGPRAEGTEVPTVRPWP